MAYLSLVLVPGDHQAGKFIEDRVCFIDGQRSIFGIVLHGQNGQLDCAKSFNGLIVETVLGHGHLTVVSLRSGVGTHRSFHCIVVVLVGDQTLTRSYVVDGLIRATLRLRHQSSLIAQCRGDDLVAKVKELIREGNVRRLFIKNEKGETLLEIPLTAGVAVTVVTAAFAPALVAVGAIAALLTSVTIGVERRRNPNDSAGENTVAVPEE